MPRGYLKTRSTGKLVGLKKARGGSGRRNAKRKQFRGGPSRWDDYFSGLHRIKFHGRYRAKQISWDSNDLDDEDDSEYESYFEFTDGDFFNHEYCHQECLEHDLSLQSNARLAMSLDDNDDGESQYSMVDGPKTNSAASLSSSWCHPISSASDVSWDLMDDIDCKEDMEGVTQVHNILCDSKCNTNETLQHKPSSQLEIIGHDHCCCICFEEKPLMQLMKRCQHPSACLDCLRQHYIVTVDISDYPLKCFYSNCDRSVHDEQLRRLADNLKELQRHYRRQTISKGRKKGVNPLTCPNCSNLRSCFAKDATRTFVSCEVCHSQFRIRGADMDATLEIFQRFPTLARCPSCQMIISKDGGCDHMTCLCGQEFDWPVSRKLFMEEVRQLLAACRIPLAIEDA